MQLRRAVPFLHLVLPTLVGAQTPTIGLITKTETNPFFVMMKKGAESAAKANGARLPVDETHLVRPTDINGINKAAGEYYHLVYNNVYGVRACSLRVTVE